MPRQHSRRHSRDSLLSVNTKLTAKAQLELIASRGFLFVFDDKFMSTTWQRLRQKERELRLNASSSQQLLRDERFVPILDSRKVSLSETAASNRIIRPKRGFNDQNQSWQEKPFGPATSAASIFYVKTLFSSFFFSFSSDDVNFTT
jgi:hypothetical protein